MKRMIEEHDILIDKDNVILAIDAHPDIYKFVSWSAEEYHKMLAYVYNEFKNNLIWQCHEYVDEYLDGLKEIEQANEDVKAEEEFQNRRDGYKRI